MAAGGGTQQFIYSREATFGTEEPSGAYQIFRATRGRVARAVRTAESALIRGDRQGAGTQPTFFASEGSLQTELIANDVGHNELIARGLYSSFDDADLSDNTKGNNKASTVDTISAGASDTFDFTGANLTTDNLQAGTWIGIKNLSAAADGWWKVLTVDDLNTITVENGGIGFDGAAKTHPGVVGGDADETYTWAMARNFTWKKGLTVERGFTDVNEYVRMLGTVVSRWGMNLASEQIATANFELLGTGYATAATSADASPGAAGTNTPLVASTDVSRIYKGGATLADVRRIEFQIDNRITQLAQVGSNVAADVIAGTYAITGTIEAYFSDRTVLEDLLGTQAAFAIETVFVDAAGHLFAVNLPAVNLVSGGIDESGSDDPVVGTYQFGGRLATNGTYLIQIDSQNQPA